MNGTLVVWRVHRQRGWYISHKHVYLAKVVSPDQQPSTTQSDLSIVQSKQRFIQNDSRATLRQQQYEENLPQQQTSISYMGARKLTVPGKASGQCHSWDKRVETGKYDGQDKTEPTVAIVTESTEEQIRRHEKTQMESVHTWGHALGNYHTNKSNRLLELSSFHLTCELFTAYHQTISTHFCTK